VQRKTKHDKDELIGGNSHVVKDASSVGWYACWAEAAKGITKSSQTTSTSTISKQDIPPGFLRQSLRLTHNTTPIIIQTGS